MTNLEREFESWIIAVAERFRWRVWHVPAPMRAIPGGKMVPEVRARGLPDLIMLSEDAPLLIFAEVKRKGGKLSEEQRLFLDLARAVGDASEAQSGTRLVGAYVFEPGMEDAIETVLRSKVLLR